MIMAALVLLVGAVPVWHNDSCCWAGDNFGLLNSSGMKLCKCTSAWKIYGDEGASQSWRPAWPDDWWKHNSEVTQSPLRWPAHIIKFCFWQAAPFFLFDLSSSGLRDQWHITSWEQNAVNMRNKQLQVSAWQSYFSSAGGGQADSLRGPWWGVMTVSLIKYEELINK